MRPGKRVRLVRLLFVLSVVFGGVSVAAPADAASSTDATQFSTLIWDWQ